VRENTNKTIYDFAAYWDLVITEINFGFAIK
jgi:hypothetical protein